jgi:CheY-like chemotaxis protein
MHALNLYLGVLLNIELPEPARPVLANIRQCAQIMDGMFLALLDLSRLDAQVVQPNIERFPIALVLSRIAVEFAPQAMAKGLDLRVVHCSVWVESDRMLVEQILRNLTANAVRYTETGRILIGCRRRGNVLRLVVHDTGIGISPDQQKAVFEEFCQIGNDRRERNKGLGLGLAIVRRLGRLLDTPITLVSALGRGALFAVDLPRAKNQLHIPAPAIAPMAAGEVLARKLVVVIDDDETILDAMRILLEQWHCIVVIAESGADAIDKLSERLQLPDALICDYRLRRQETGLDVIRTLRNEFNHDIPSLLITGDTAPEEIQKTLLDTVPVLHKPIQAATLHAALIKLIQVH